MLIIEKLIDLGVLEILKIKISLGEASETDYWLEIIEELKWINNVNLKDLRKEAKELLAIFTSIANKL